MTLTCSKSVLYVLKWTLQCSRLPPLGTIWRKSRMVTLYSMTIHPSNRSSVLKGVKTIGFRHRVPQSSPLGHPALSNMAPLGQQSQSLASRLGLSGPHSPQDEANPLHPLDAEYLDKLVKNFDPVPGQPNDIETFLADIEDALDGYGF